MSLRDVPGPRLPMWTQTACYGLRPVPFLEWCQRRYGDMFTIRLPAGSTMVVLADPAAIRHVTALEASQFSAASAASMVEPFVGARSVVLMDGERHRRERQLLVRGLHVRAMDDYALEMAEATRRDMATWPLDQPFALHPRLQAITLAVIVRLILGADDTERTEALTHALRPWLQHAGSLLLLLEPLRHELAGHGPWGRFVAQRREIDRVLTAHIAARRADPDLADRRDVLSALLRADEAEEAGDAGEDAGSLLDELMTMLAAGHDTSATALAWAFTLVLRHPRVLERLLAEIAAGEEAYLDAVVKESLRLCPVVLEMARHLTQEVTINGVRIPAGTTVAASTLLVQRRADCYTDPLAFRPERFLGQPADPHTWLPFGGGIRRCIGAAFAMMEIKTVLRTVLSDAELRPVGRMEKPRRRAVTMIPSRGARVVMTARRDRSPDVGGSFVRCPVRTPG